MISGFVLAFTLLTSEGWSMNTTIPFESRRDCLTVVAELSEWVEMRDGARIKITSMCEPAEMSL